MTFSKLVRRTHMYLALFLFPWVLMYAVSTLAMNHRAVFVRMYGPGPVPFEKEREVVYDGAGQLNYFVVYKSQNTFGGDLYRYDATGAHFMLHEVLSVHAFKDPQGQLGIDVVQDRCLMVEIRRAGR